MATQSPVIYSRSEEETEAIGAQLATTLHGGERIALSGDLGAGKTVFTRGLARGLGEADRGKHQHEPDGDDEEHPNRQTAHYEEP